MKEEQHGIKDGLTFHHIVLLLWEGEDLSNRVGRRHRGCTRRRLDRVF
jgi:hypothetical protein